MKLVSEVIRVILFTLVLLVAGMLARATIEVMSDHTVPTNMKVWVIILIAFLLLYNVFMSFVKER